MGTRVAESRGLPETLRHSIDSHDFILASDEAGLGSWCGPLSVCAVVAPRDWSMAGVTDSKKLSRAARERIYPSLIQQVTYCLVHIEAEEFDALGASKAFVEAHTRAITGALQAHRDLGHKVAPLIIIDGIRSVASAMPIPKADALIPACSAGSIIAKVNHDWRMDELDKQYPGYGLSVCSGYGTPAHRIALQRLGVSPAHRRSYQPMRDLVAQTDSLLLGQD